MRVDPHERKRLEQLCRYIARPALSEERIHLDATLLESLIAGEHCLHGFTNRDIRSRLNGTRWLRACADDPKKASAKVGRCLRRLHAHGLIARIPRTWRWRVTSYARKVMGTTMYLREFHFPNVYAAVMH